MFTQNEYKPHGVLLIKIDNEVMKIQFENIRIQSISHTRHNTIDGERLKVTQIMKTNGTGIEINIICEENIKTEDTGDKW